MIHTNRDRKDSCVTRLGDRVVALANADSRPRISRCRCRGWRVRAPGRRALRPAGKQGRGLSLQRMCGRHSNQGTIELEPGFWRSRGGARMGDAVDRKVPRPSDLKAGARAGRRKDGSNGLARTQSSQCPAKGGASRIHIGGIKRRFIRTRAVSTLDCPLSRGNDGRWVGTACDYGRRRPVPRTRGFERRECAGRPVRAHAMRPVAIPDLGLRNQLAAGGAELGVEALCSRSPSRGGWGTPFCARTCPRRLVCVTISVGVVRAVALAMGDRAVDAVDHLHGVMAVEKIGHQSSRSPA